MLKNWVFLNSVFPGGQTEKLDLTLNVPCISESCIEIKIKLNLYFHTFLWCLKRFYEDLKGPYKTFWGTAKKCEDKHLT